jgi:hypothetical protein
VNHLIAWLHKQHCPRPALEEVADMALGASQNAELAQRVSVLAASFVVMETILEDAGLLTPERMEACKAKVAAKMSGMQAAQQEAAPEPEQPAEPETDKPA